MPEGAVSSTALSLTLPAGAARASDVWLIKIADAATARPFGLVSTASELSADGTFGLWDGQRFLLPSDALDPTRTYTLILSIRDGGPYDLNPTGGAILDPCVVGFRTDPTATATPAGGGGGGCALGLLGPGGLSSGARVLPSPLLLGLPLLFLARRRR